MLFATSNVEARKDHEKRVSMRQASKKQVARKHCLFTHQPEIILRTSNI